MNPPRVRHDAAAIMAAACWWVIGITINAACAGWAIGAGHWPRAILPALGTFLLLALAWRDISTRLVRLVRWSQIARRW